MKILTILTLTTQLLTPFAGGQIIQERIKNSTGSGNGVYAGLVQASYSYSTSDANFTYGADLPITYQFTTPLTYYLDIEMNLREHVDYCSMSCSLTYPATNDYYLNYVGINCQITASNTSYNSFSLNIYNTDHATIRFIFTLEQLKDNYNYTSTGPTPTDMSVEWVENGYNYVDIITFNVNTVSFTPEDPNYTPYLDGIEGYIDGIETSLGNIYTNVDSIKTTLNNINTNVSNINDLMKRIEDYMDYNFHYFQLRINDSAVDGYPLIIDTINDLDELYYFKELDSYSIKRIDIRTKQQFVNGNYIVYSFYFKSSVQITDSYANDMWIRVRDNDGRLADVIGYKVYINNGYTVDDRMYYSIYTIYIPLYNFVFRTADNLPYNFNLSMAIRNNSNIITGVTKVGVIYRGIVETLPDMQFLGDTVYISDTQVNNQVTEYNTTIDNVYTIENNFNTQLQSALAQYSPDNSSVLNKLQYSTVIYSNILGRLNNISVFALPLAVALAGIILIAVLG